MTPVLAVVRCTTVTGATKKQLKATFEKLTKSGKLDFGPAPKGGSFIRVPLKTGKTDQYSYTALLPAGGKTDPNKAGGFLLER